MATTVTPTRSPAPRPPAESNKAEQFVQAQIQRARQRVRLTELGKAGLGCLILIAGYTVVLVYLDRLFELSAFVRQALFTACCLTMTAYVGWTVIWPFCQRINPYYAARLVEQNLEADKNSLINWLDLREQPLVPAFRTAITNQAARDLDKIDLEQAIATRPSIFTLSIIGAMLVLLLLLFAASPRQFLSLMKRAWSPYSDASIATRTRLTLIEPPDGDLTVAIGKAVTIVVQVDGRMPEQQKPDALRVLYRASPADPYDARLLDPTDDPQRWRTTFLAQELKTGVFYKVAGGDDSTPEYRIQVRSNPLLTNVDVTYHYRPYLHWPDRSAQDPNLKDLRGTEVLLTAHTNRAVREGRLVIEGQQFVPAEIRKDDPESLHFRLTLTQDTEYRIFFTSVQGESNRDPMAYTIQVLADQAPAVVLTAPGRDVEKGVNEILALEGQASDDLGLAALTLRLRKEDGKLLEPQPYRQGKALLRGDGRPPQMLEYKDSIDFAKLREAGGAAFKPQPGQTIEYWLEATDHCDFPEPNVGSSKHFKVAFRDPVDPKKQQSQRDKAAKDQQEHDKKQDQQLQEQQGDGSGEKSPLDEQKDKQSGDQQKDKGGQSGDQQKDKGGQSGDQQKDKVGQSGDQQKDKGGQSGDQQKDKGGQTGVQLTDKGGQSGDPHKDQGSQSGDQQKDKGGQSGDQQKDKGGQSGDQQKDKGGQSGDQQKDKGGQSGDQQKDKSGQSGDQQKDKGGQSSDQQKDKGGQSGDQQKDKGGQSGDQQKDKGGQSGEQQKDKGGQSVDQQKDKGGQSSDQQKDKGGQSGDQQKDKGGQSGDLQKDNGGQSGDQQKDKGGQSSDQQKDKGGQSGDQQKDKGGQSGDQQKDKGGQSGDQQKDKSGQSGDQQKDKGGQSGDQQKDKGGQSGDQQKDKGGQSGDQQKDKGGQSGDQQKEKGGQSGEQNQSQSDKEKLDQQMKKLQDALDKTRKGVGQDQKNSDPKPGAAGDKEANPNQQNKQPGAKDSNPAGQDKTAQPDPAKANESAGTKADSGKKPADAGGQKEANPKRSQDKPGDGAKPKEGAGGKSANDAAKDDKSKENEKSATGTQGAQAPDKKDGDKGSQKNDKGAQGGTEGERKAADPKQDATGLDRQKGDATDPKGPGKPSDAKDKNDGTPPATSKEKDPAGATEAHQPGAQANPDKSAQQNQGKQPEGANKGEPGTEKTGLGNKQDQTVKPDPQKAREALEKLQKDLQSPDGKTRADAEKKLEEIRKLAQDPEVRKAAEAMKAAADKAQQGSKAGDSPKKGDGQSSERQPGDPKTDKGQEPGKDKSADQGKPGDSQNGSKEKQGGSDTTGSAGQGATPAGTEAPRSKDKGKEGDAAPPQGQGRPVDGEGQRPSPPSTPPEPPDGKKFRDLAGDLVLDKVKKHVTDDVLKEANMSRAEFEQFTKAYENMLKTEQAKVGENEKLPAPNKGGAAQPNRGLHKVETSADAKISAERSGPALAPAEFRDAYNKFSRRLSEMGTKGDKK